jgi:hypothetical protein
VCQREQWLLRQWSTAKVNSEQCGLRAQSQSRRQKAHWTVNCDCPVHHRTIQWPSCQKLQRSNPNSWVTWLAHRTVRCARRQQSSPTATLVVGAINSPQPPHFKASKFSAIAFNTRALDFTPRHKQEIKSSPKSKDHSKHLVTSEREICVHLSSCRLDRFSSSPILVLNTFVIKARDTKLWWSL